MTWYQFYVKQRAIQLPPIGQRTDYDRSRVAAWNGEDPTAPDFVQNAVKDFALETSPGGVHSEVRHGYVKNYPDDFLALSGKSPSGGGGPTYAPSVDLVNSARERRRLRAAMVNCSVITGQVPDSNGDTRVPNDGGTYDVTLEDMRIMDVYVPNPAGIFCGHNTVACDIPESIETTMYIELIEDVTDEVTSDNFIVQLVR